MRYLILLALTGCSTTHPMFEDFAMSISRNRPDILDQPGRLSYEDDQAATDAAVHNNVFNIKNENSQMQEWATIAPVTVFQPLCSPTGESIAFAKAFD